MTCHLAHLDGSYVLGALSPAERLEFERHLPQCAECSRAVRELAGLPGLLGQVDIANLDPGTSPPLPDTLLPALVREVRGAQRRRSVLVATVAASVAAVAVVAFALAGGLGDGRGDGSDRAATPTPSVTSSPTGRPMAASGRTPVRADLLVTGVAWGTRLDLTCSYVADAADYDGSGDGQYALVVRTRDGKVEQVATWRALPGRTMRLSAATATDRSDISAVELQNAGGTVLLRLTV
jgi:hypothetical protein